MGKSISTWRWIQILEGITRWLLFLQHYSHSPHLHTHLMSAAEGAFTPFRPGGRSGHAKLEPTGGYKALIALGFLFLILAMGAAIATLVLVAIRFEQNCCGEIKDKLHHLEHLLEDNYSCSTLGESCHSTKDCCGHNTLVCSSGTCQAIVTGSNSGKHKK